MLINGKEDKITHHGENPMSANRRTVVMSAITNMPVRTTAESHCHRHTRT